MNLRCAFCQTPFAIGRVEKIAALQHMYAENQTHYDAHCPRCRKATPVLRQKLELTLPNWRDALQELEVEMAANPQKPIEPPKPDSDSGPQADAQSEDVPAKSKIKGETKAKPPSKRQIGQPPAARAEKGRKPPARNTPSQGKKRNK